MEFNQYSINFTVILYKEFFFPLLRFQVKYVKLKIGQVSVYLQHEWKWSCKIEMNSYCEHGVTAIAECAHRCSLEIIKHQRASTRTGQPAAIK